MPPDCGHYQPIAAERLSFKKYFTEPWLRGFGCIRLTGLIREGVEEIKKATPMVLVVLAHLRFLPKSYGSELMMADGDGFTGASGHGGLNESLLAAKATDWLLLKMPFLQRVDMSTNYCRLL